ncbi:sugar-binding protein [Methanobrevibacter sp.]
MQTNLLFFGLPNAYYNAKDVTYTNAPTTPDNIEGFANYAESLLKYSESGFYDTVEYLNEPNGPKYPATKYTNLAMVTSNRLKRLGYEGNIDGFSLYNFREKEWVEENFESGIYPYITSVAIHPYGFGAGENYSDSSTASENKIIDQYNNILNAGGWKDMDVTEIGSSTNGSSGVSDESQAINLVKDKCKFDKYNLIGYYVYDLIDDGIEPYARESNFGLVNHIKFGRIPKKAYAAYATLNNETNGGLALGTIDMGKSNGQILAYVYEKDGKPLVIAWDSNTKDNLDRTLYFTGETVTVTDMYGNDLGEFKDSIKLTKEPVYIHGLSDKWVVSSVLNEVSKRIDVWLANYEENLPEIILARSNFDDIKSTLTEDVTTTILAENLDKLTKLGTQIIEQGKKGAFSDKEVSKQLFQLYEVMIYLDRLYAALYDGEEVTKLYTDIESAKKLANERYWDDWYVKPYSDEILRHATRFYKRANEIMMSEEENTCKAGVINAWDMLATSLTQWFEAFSEYEHAYNYGLISNISVETSNYLETSYDGEHKIIDIKVINKGNDAFKGTLQVFDEVDNLVYETPQVTVVAGEEKDTFVEVDCNMISGTDSRKFTINFVNSEGYIEATRTHKIQISPLLEASVMDCDPDITPEELKSVKIKVRNLHNINASADIELSTSDNIKLGQEKINISLTPLEEKIIEIPVKNIINTKYHHYVVNYKISNSNGVILREESVPLSFMPVVKASSPIDPATWDGDTSDWYDSYPIYRGSVNNANEPEQYLNADIAIRIMKKWDEEHLYLLIEAYDNAHSVMYTGTQLWDGDALQVSIDPLNDGTNTEVAGSAKYREDDYEIGFALTGLGSEAYQWSGPKTVAMGTVEWIKIIRDSDTNCTKYLLAVPVEEFDLQKLSENAVVAFNVAINEADALGREEYFQITKGTADGKYPDYYYDYPMVMPTTEEYAKGTTNPMP